MKKIKLSRGQLFAIVCSNVHLFCENVLDIETDKKLLNAIGDFVYANINEYIGIASSVDEKEVKKQFEETKAKMTEDEFLESFIKTLQTKN